MAEDISSTASNTIPFPTLTIVYLVTQAKDYKKITIWSQGIDSLWFNALIARIKEIANVNSVPIVSGGIMYTV
jgi:hypothetical protein